MRLQRLDLIRYGHFKDSSNEFPSKKYDFHLVFGQNEAGKSTALAAIEDMLFGIPPRSPYNFLHDYAKMRVGAVLENGGTSLEVQRRKGIKDTLLGSDGFPVKDGDNALRPYLSGADQSFFQRMFSLDHSRLREGGKEILAAKDEVGQILFSAGAGIVGFRQRLNRLLEEADGLWAPRRAKHRKYYITLDKFNAANQALREQTLSAKNWLELKQAYEKSEEIYARIDNKIKETFVKRNRLSRIRRVYPDVSRIQELEHCLIELQNVVLLSENSAKMLEEFEKKEHETVTRIATLQEPLDRAKAEIKELSFDETLLQREADVRDLYERRIEIRKEKADLPKRYTEMNAAKEDLQVDARELEWAETDSATIIKRIPSRIKVGQARSLLSQRGELEAETRNSTHVLTEAREDRDEIKQQLDQMRQPVDVSKLDRAIRTLRERGDLDAQVRSAEKSFKAVEQKVQRKIKVLDPGGIDENTLVNLTVPVQATVQDYLEKWRDWKRRRRETRQKTSLVKQELDRTIAVLKQIVQDEQVVTSQELKDSRDRRDSLWNLVKVKYVEDGFITEEQFRGLEKDLDNLTDSFESALANADNLADRRFDRAEAVGRISEINRKIVELNVQYEQMLRNQGELEDEGVRLKSEWKKMWLTAPFEPLSAELMLEWLNNLEEALELIEEQKSALHELKALRDERLQAKERIFDELTVLGIDSTSMKSESLNVIIECASDEVRRQKDKADKKLKFETDLANATKDVKRKKKKLRIAKKNQNEWRKKWDSALGELGLEKGTLPEVVNSQIEVIERMRKTAERIRTLRYDRIDKIIRDIKDFEQVVSELVKDIAADLVDEPAESAVLEMESRVNHARRVQELQNSKNTEITKAEKQIENLERERKESLNLISQLMTKAGVESIEALKKAIELSDQKRVLEQKRHSVIEKLDQDGDGKSIAELKEECESADIDDVAAQEASNQTELDDLQNQLTVAVEKRSQARNAFQAVGGDDSAAQNAARKEEAVTEMKEIVEKYIRVQTSVKLLQWAIDHYRREKQAPLLNRASEHFNSITDCSFSNLRVEYDDKDVPHLTGVRPSKEIVPVSGLSTGTADQLYLSLRIAAIEDYLERSDALPFIADDLFINFDDERAAAGFQRLAELSRKTQILFFTHHQHLVKIALDVLGPSVNLVTLSDPRRVDN